jgi:hypothetical protein
VFGGRTNVNGKNKSGPSISSVIWQEHNKMVQRPPRYPLTLSSHSCLRCSFHKNLPCELLLKFILSNGENHSTTSLLDAALCTLFQDPSSVHPDTNDNYLGIIALCCASTAANAHHNLNSASQILICTLSH